MDRDIELLGIDVDCLIADLQCPFTSEQVDPHALNGADVYKCVAELGSSQEFVGHDIGVPGAALIQIGLLEPLGIDRVDFVELESRLGLKRSKRADRLSSERATV